MLILAGCQKAETPAVEEPEEAAQEQEVSKPSVPPEQLYEYLLPFEYRWLIGQSSYEQMLSDIDKQDYKPLPPINDFYYDIEIVEDRSAAIRVTEQQKQAIIPQLLQESEWKISSPTMQ